MCCDIPGSDTPMLENDCYFRRAILVNSSPVYTVFSLTSVKTEAPKNCADN
jgi:hypothetical protein